MVKAYTNTNRAYWVEARTVRRRMGSRKARKGMTTLAWAQARQAVCRPLVGIGTGWSRAGASMRKGLERLGQASDAAATETARTVLALLNA